MSTDTNLYKCIRCNKTFTNNKYNFRKHFYKKTTCKSIIFDIDIKIIIDKINNNEYLEFYEHYVKNKKQCMYCKSITNKYNLNRHLKKCKLNPENQNSKELVSKNISDTKNNIIINNNNCIIQINNFGSENLSKIDYSNLVFKTKEFYNKYSIHEKENNHFHNIKLLFEDIYSQPENKTFELVNKKEQKYKIKIDDDKYINKSINELSIVINEILVNIYENYLEKNKEILQHYIDHLNQKYKQLQLYNNNPNNKIAYKYKILDNKIQKCLKKAILWLAEDDKQKNVVKNI